MNYARQFAQHAALTVITAVLGGALFYALRIVLYKHLSQEDYGLFYVVLSFVTIVQTLITFGFDPGLVPFVTQFREEKNPDAIKSVFIGSLVPQAAMTLSVVVLFLVMPPLLAPWAEGYVDAPASIRALAHPATPSLFRVLALHAVFVLLFKCVQNVMLGLQAIAWRNAADLARAVCCLGVAAAMLQLGWGLRATAVAYTVGALAEVVVLGAALFNSFPQIAGARFTWRPTLIRQVFDAGKWLSIGFGGFALFSSVDTVVISIVRKDLSDAAAYQVALPTITIFYSLMIAAGVSLLPMVRTLWLRGERAFLAGSIERLYAAAIVVMVPGGVLLACGSDVLMPVLFGANILNASDAFDVLAVGGIVFFLAYVNLHILAGIESPRAAGMAVIGGLLVDVALNVPLTYWFGIRGTAIAGVCGYGLVLGIGLAAIRGSLAFAFPVRAAIGGIGIGAAAGLAAWCCRAEGWIAVQQPILSAICCVIIFTAGLGIAEILGLSDFRTLLRGVVGTTKK
jgi:O-antigen/teichoic acid export membrane protein